MDSPIHGEYKNLSFVFVQQLFMALTYHVLEIKVIVAVF